MQKAVTVSAWAVFVLICVAIYCSSHLASDGSTSVLDAAHTYLIQGARGGPHYVPSGQYVKWEVTNAVTVLLVAAWIALMAVGRKFQAPAAQDGAKKQPR